jgi:hypothetical protein
MTPGMSCLRTCWSSPGHFTFALLSPESQAQMVADGVRGFGGPTPRSRPKTGHFQVRVPQRIGLRRRNAFLRKFPSSSHNNPTSPRAHDRQHVTDRRSVRAVWRKFAYQRNSNSSSVTELVGLDDLEIDEVVLHEPVWRQVRLLRRSSTCPTAPDVSS